MIGSGDIIDNGTSEGHVPLLVLGGPHNRAEWREGRGWVVGYHTAVGLVLLEITNVFSPGFSL